MFSVNGVEKSLTSARVNPIAESRWTRIRTPRRVQDVVKRSREQIAAMLYNQDGPGVACFRMDIIYILDSPNPAQSYNMTWSLRPQYGMMN